MAWLGLEKLFLYYFYSMLLISIKGSTEIFNLTQPKIYHLKLDLDPFISSNDHIFLFDTGNVIFDIVEPPAFQNYRICCVFHAVMCLWQICHVHPQHQCTTGVIFSVLSANCIRYQHLTHADWGQRPYHIAVLQDFSGIRLGNRTKKYFSDLHLGQY